MSILECSLDLKEAGFKEGWDGGWEGGWVWGVGSGLYHSKQLRYCLGEPRGA